MTIAEFITNEIGRDNFDLLVHNGIIPMQTAKHLDIYEWHIAHKRNRYRTGRQFGVSPSSVNYAVTKMKQQLTL